MIIIVNGTDTAKQQLWQPGLPGGIIVEHVSSAINFLQYPAADAYIDLSFDDHGETALLKNLKGTVIINSVCKTLTETDASFIRINGWPGFLNSPIIEASGADENLKNKAAAVFEKFNKTIEWLPDEPGFVTPRVVSMIINEAYYSLEEGVSTKAEIDTAMKLGTAYPYGPFEWGQKIGLGNIVRLLTRLSKEREQYTPAPLLVEEAVQAKN